MLKTYRAFNSRHFAGKLPPATIFRFTSQGQTERFGFHRIVAQELAGCYRQDESGAYIGIRRDLPKTGAELTLLHEMVHHLLRQLLDSDKALAQGWRTRLQMYDDWQHRLNDGPATWANYLRIIDEVLAWL